MVGSVLADLLHTSASLQISSLQHGFGYKVALCGTPAIGCDKWASSCKNVSYVIFEQQRHRPASHPRSLISTIVVCCLDRMICILAISKDLSFKILASFCSWAGQKSPKTHFRVVWLKWSWRFLDISLLKSQNLIYGYFRQYLLLVKLFWTVGFCLYLFILNCIMYVIS